jgi:hypothetical protein
MVAGLLLGGMVLGQPMAARAANGGADAGLSLAAAATNIFYIPTKFVLAGLGLMTGGLVGVLTWGDTRGPGHLDGSERLQVFGTDYSDHPSTMSREGDGSAIYDAAYNSM